MAKCNTCGRCDYCDLVQDMVTSCADHIPAKGKISIFNAIVNGRDGFLVHIEHPWRARSGYIDTTNEPFTNNTAKGAALEHFKTLYPDYVIGEVQE